MKRWIGFLLPLCVLLAACAPGAADAGSARPHTEIPAPPPPGELRLVYDAAPETLRWTDSRQETVMALCANTADTLLTFDAGGALRPALAESWKPGAGERRWTLTLRDDAVWVDAQGNEAAPVTAEDFVAAARYILDPANESPAAAALMALLENAEEYHDALEAGEEPPDFAAVGVHAPDAHTLVYTLKKDAPDFLSRLTDWPFLPLPPGDGALYCGPFYLAAYERCGEILLQKNPFFRQADEVFLDTVRLSYDPDASLTAPALAAEGLIGYAALDGETAAAWLADPARSMLVSRRREEGTRSYFLCFNFSVRAREDDYARASADEWSLDERYAPENWERAVNCEAFRQSLCHAVDRAALYTDGRVSGTITPPVWGAAVPPDVYDPALARTYRDAAAAELTQQGAAFPVKVLLPCPGDDEDACARAERLAAQLESVLGEDYIDVLVERRSAEDYWTRVRRAGAYMLLECFWDADSPDADTWTRPFYQVREPDGSYGRGFRYAYLAEAILGTTASAGAVEEYFTLVETARARTDAARRAAAFAAAEERLLRYALVLPLGAGESEYAVSRLDQSACAGRGLGRRSLQGARLTDRALTLADTAWSAPAPPERAEKEMDLMVTPIE